MASRADPDTVEAHLTFALWLLDDERDRGKHLDTKSASLAGFAGVVLGLVLAFGREVLKTSLGSVGDILAPIVFGIASLALATGALLAILGILRPQRHLTIPDAVLRHLASDGVEQGVDQARGRLLSTLVHSDAAGGPSILSRERVVNDRKAGLASAAAWALAVGYVAAATLALILTLRELGL